MASVLELELQRLRSMTASDKISAMQALWREAWSLSAAGVRGRHPDWEPAQVEAEVRRLFQRAVG